MFERAWRSLSIVCAAFIFVAFEGSATEAGQFCQTDRGYCEVLAGHTGEKCECRAPPSLASITIAGSIVQAHSLEGIPATRLLSQREYELGEPRIALENMEPHNAQQQENGAFGKLNLETAKQHGLDLNEVQESNNPTQQENAAIEEPRISGLPGQKSSGIANSIRTTRNFFGPHDIPPVNFAAYGIVAFPQKATSVALRRHVAICEAFMATLPSVSASSASVTEQMVTVWPVDDPTLARRLNSQFESVSVCQEAVAHYDLSTALIALKEAQTQKRKSLAGSGPYLLAWSPSSQKGKKGSIVLIADLSNATTAEQYLNYFQKWRNDIEQNPELWRDGWSEAGLTTVIRDWLDKWGTMILSVGHAEGEGG
jgi:hypothetical protein